jgi:general nucleoside transport system permease protein
MSDIFQATIIVGLLTSTIRIATPFLFASIGELVTERSGVLNLGVEGMLQMGALVGFLIAFWTGYHWLGVLGAALAGMLLGLFMGWMVTTLKLNQTVSGLALNILAGGIAFYWFRVIFSGLGSQNLPNLKIFQTARIPLLSDIPYIGEILFRQHWLTYIAFLTVPLVAYFLYKTRLGLQLRSTGENPRAVDMKGLSVAKHQYGALAFGGLMAGIGGSFLTLASSGMFIPEIQAGRGWIAIALVIFGNWIPWRIMVVALFFGFIEAMQLTLQAVNANVPHQLLLALPYLLTIIALCASAGRSRRPLHLGIPYKRE